MDGEKEGGEYYAENKGGNRGIKKYLQSFACSSLFQQDVRSSVSEAILFCYQRDTCFRSSWRFKFCYKFCEFPSWLASYPYHLDRQKELEDEEQTKKAGLGEDVCSHFFVSSLLFLKFFFGERSKEVGVQEWCLQRAKNLVKTQREIGFQQN